jgi:hypothetical protein
MGHTVANQSSQPQPPASDAPARIAGIEHHLRGPLGRPAALMLTEDGKVLISVDARLDDEGVDAAVRKLVEAALVLFGGGEVARPRTFALMRDEDPSGV